MGDQLVIVTRPVGPTPPLQVPHLISSRWLTAVTVPSWNDTKCTMRPPASSCRHRRFCLGADAHMS